MVALAATPNESARTAERERLSIRDPQLRWVLVLAVVLLAASWRLQRGYPLADAVEFLDRAQAWVAGAPLSDARTVRSFAFSALFVPLFQAAEWFGLTEPRVLLAAARLIEVGLTLGLCVACARLGERAVAGSARRSDGRPGELPAGRSAGLAAAVVVALNPVVLQFGVWPISGIAAALCLALGLERLIERPEPESTGRAGRGWREGLAGGAFFGLAFLTAYQSLLVALAIVVVLVARDRWASRGTWLGIGVALLGAMALQVGLDRLVYGSFQGSLWRYLLENVGYVIVHFLTDVGWDVAARDLYEQISSLRGTEYLRDDSVTHARMRFGAFWYLANAPSFFVWPVLLLVCAGIVRATLRPRWTTSIALVALVLSLAIMAKKGDKSLRLMLPLLPLCVPLLASAWEAGLSRPSLRFLSRLLLIGALPLALVALADSKPRANAAYWDAADWVGENRTPNARERCASAYDWATFLRQRPGVERVKLAAPLERWDALDDATRARLVEQLASIDRLILHQSVLAAQPGLARELAGSFAVEAAFYDQDEAYELGAVLVLRRSDAPEDRRLFRFSPTAPRPAHARSILYRPDGAGEPLEFLGFDLDRLGGDGWWWITYHWKLPATPRTLEVHDRVTSPDEKNTWQNDHALARGAPWPEGGGYLSEGFLFVPSAVDASREKRFHPLGGPYRRGELLPLSLYVEVLESESASRWSTFRAGASEPVEIGLEPELAANGWRWTLDGYRFSVDGLTRVGSFFLPVHPRAYARDDGKPVPD